MKPRSLQVPAPKGDKPVCPKDSSIEGLGFLESRIYLRALQSPARTAALRNKRLLIIGLPGLRGPVFNLLMGKMRFAPIGKWFIPGFHRASIIPTGAGSCPSTVS